MENAKNERADIYNQPQQLDYWLKRLDGEPIVTSENKATVREFIRKGQLDGLRLDTLVKKLPKLLQLSRLLEGKAWKKLKRKDWLGLKEAIVIDGRGNDGG
ncbi:MAG: hypothetical protein NTY90_05780, partial [Candidatus Micrarchaeota archaeon]|nr:hypothetical protein [Candidatus Micrarchaeota archaeon]